MQNESGNQMENIQYINYKWVKKSPDVFNMCIILSMVSGHSKIAELCEMQS
jgi:hypothetical protein